MSFERPKNLCVKEFTDVVFIVDGERVPAHKLILASQSEYFRAMLYGEMKEASQEDIPLPDIPLASFKTVLQYAYTGTLEIEDQLEVSSYIQQQLHLHIMENPLLLEHPGDNSCCQFPGFCWYGLNSRRTYCKVCV